MDSRQYPTTNHVVNPAEVTLEIINDTSYKRMHKLHSYERRAHSSSLPISSACSSLVIRTLSTKSNQSVNMATHNP